MPKEKQLHRIAKKMLDPSVARENKRLHPDLKKQLDEADKLCQNAGGVLVSRQGIAAIIVCWQERHPAIQPLLDNE